MNDDGPWVLFAGFGHYQSQPERGGYDITGVLQRVEVDFGESIIERAPDGVTLPFLLILECGHSQTEPDADYPFTLHCTSPNGMKGVSLEANASAWPGLQPLWSGTIRIPQPHSGRYQFEVWSGGQRLTRFFLEVSVRRGRGQPYLPR